MFIGRNDAKAETPVLWPPHARSWLIGKDPVAGRDWWQEEKGLTEDKTARWHHRLNRHEFVWTPGVGDGQGGLACCDSWDRKESDTTEWLNWLTAYKLTKQGGNMHLCIAPFPIWNQSNVPCPVLTVASWPAYRFLKRSSIPISWGIFHSLLWSTQ